MTSVTQLRNGSWLVFWDTQLTPYKPEVRETNVSCPLDFKIITLVSGNIITLQIEDTVMNLISIKLNKFKKKILLAKASKTGDSIKSVSAIYNFQHQEMTESSNGSWGPVSGQVAGGSSDTNNDWAYAIFILIMDYTVKECCTCSDGQKKILDHLNNLMLCPSFADVQFVVKGETINAHSAVVSSSPGMASLIEKNRKKVERLTLQVDDMEPAAFNELLRYLYTGALTINDSNMTEQLFTASEQFEIETLKIICEDDLLRRLNFDNAVHFLVLAHQNESPYLLEACLELLNKHKKDVWALAEWRSLSQTYPELFFIASHRMIGGT